MAIDPAARAARIAGWPVRKKQNATRVISDRGQQTTMNLEHYVVASARVVELAGVAVLLLGAVFAGCAFARRLVRRAVFHDAYHALRADLGRAILLGLELLVIADIIGTVAIEPTLQNLGVLAVIVAIRTFLSFALELEVTGRWPWQHARDTVERPGNVS
jgi:uncharacterized membrane protein